MSRRSPTWTCQKVTAKVPCKAVNLNKFQVCQTCGKRKAPRKPPAHESALALPMSYYVEVNGGPDCGICGKPPGPDEKFHRDHEHVGLGYPRGVLCFPCNAGLRPYMNLDWCRRAVAYLERAEARRPR